jgi:hypothetical protein
MAWTVIKAKSYHLLQHAVQESSCKSLSPEQLTKATAERLSGWKDVHEHNAQSGWAGTWLKIESALDDGCGRAPIVFR